MAKDTIFLLTEMYYRPSLNEFAKGETIPFSCKSAMMRYLNQGIDINKAYDVEWSALHLSREDNMLDYKTMSVDDVPREVKKRYFWGETIIYTNNRLP